MIALRRIAKFGIVLGFISLTNLYCEEVPVDNKKLSNNTWVKIAAEKKAPFCSNMIYASDRGAILHWGADAFASGSTGVQVLEFKAGKWIQDYLTDLRGYIHSSIILGSCWRQNRRYALKVLWLKCHTPYHMAFLSSMDMVEQH